ncbi:MAG: ribosomal L7Ae/L30e/S12e/Gadd45 family protein [Clostridia bacterium]|nr:ribosomal L7Ae/L30e/S12e/Gadd45 family protein [Clostridia bacterium]
MNESEKKSAAGLMGLLGLCARAGKLICGTSQICDGLRDKKNIFMVLMADGVSENTKKRLSDKCKYYGVRLECLEVGTGELAHALGKSGELAAVGVTDGHFAAGLEKLL